MTSKPGILPVLAPASHFNKTLELIKHVPVFSAEGAILRINDTYDDFQDGSRAFTCAYDTARHIDTQMKEHQQKKNFKEYFTDLPGRDTDGSTGRSGPPASAWIERTMAAFQMYYVPMEDWDAIIPQELLPSDSDIDKLFPGVFNAQYNEAFLNKRENLATITDEKLRLLFSAVWQLLQPNSVYPNDDDARNQDQDEIASNTLFRKVAEYMRINDPAYSEFVLKEERKIQTRFGPRYAFTSKNEFAIMNAKDITKGPVLGFTENKRLVLPEFPKTVAQKAAESLAVALESTSRRCPPQEVLAICVRHRFFSFWNTVFPSEYIEAVRDDPTALKPDHYVWVKTYPATSFGLDFCNPDDRRKIFRGFHAIIEYMKAGPRMGSYSESSTNSTV